MSFNFGTSSSGGFSFGAPRTTAPTAGTGFTFGGSTPAVPSTGFTFGTTTQAPASTTTPSTQTSQPSGLFSFSTPVTSATPAPGFSFGAQPTSATSSGGLVLGSTAPKLGLGGVTQPSSGTSLSGAAQAPGFTFATAIAQPNSAPASTGGGFSFTGAVVTTSLPSTTATITATTHAASNTVQTPGTVLGSTTSSASGTLGLGSSLTTSTASLFSITPTTSASATLASKPQTTGVVQSITTGGSAPVSTPAVMTYNQLETLINKWSLELEDQEKHFIQQATQVNAWDRTLIHNGERITALHREMEKVKLDQKRLDQELDFILSQQKELEDLLTPLEESVKEQSGTIYLQHADEEREKTYKLAENIDAQLKRMAQDLKEVIEHLNTTAGPGDASNPLQQICKILNAHVDSLQWIDQNSALLQRKVEQVAKECESRRKEQERGFSITFD
ncbi:nucleoporin-62 C-terminal-like protein isoform X2 [Dendropsophus ebraccatus]|uniref:nucleoporin-62 C-terminal-like protein isoform X2 n=1 Tax=Dendropsophus ebraccatus TaxID=150705 RepID=UPI0038322A11